MVILARMPNAPRLTPADALVPDTAPRTRGARLVDGLRAGGYRLVTLDELL